jgi:predicted dinucleotide-utilizing enzyme
LSFMIHAHYWGIRMNLEETRKEASRIVDLITASRFDDKSEFLLAVFIEAATRINRIDQWDILQNAKKKIVAQLGKLREEEIKNQFDEMCSKGIK